MWPLLRYARALGIDVGWNLLGGFPGDRREDYEEMVALLPAIVHLQPPEGFGMLRLDRFSPYYTSPEQYGIRNVRPKPIYHQVFPPTADLDQLAYYFDCDYECGAFECPDVIAALQEATKKWGFALACQAPPHPLRRPSLR